jgi:hypothetical protein
MPRLLQSERVKNALRPLKMADTTHTTIRRHIIEDQNLQQRRWYNITCLKCRCLRSHSYNQTTCMLCYLLFTLISVYIRSLVSVSCATEPSAYHSTAVQFISAVMFLLAVLQSHLHNTVLQLLYNKYLISMSNTTQIAYCNIKISNLHLSLRSVDTLRSIPDSQST